MTQAKQNVRMERRQAVETALHAFINRPLKTAALGFWEALGYHSSRTIEVQFADLLDHLPPDEHGNLAAKLGALEPQIGEFHLLFQLTTEDVRTGGQATLISGQYQNSNIESYIFVAVRLKAGQQPPRSILADMARTLNRAFRQPVLTLFVTGTGEETRVSLTAVQRRINKRDADRDVLGKVTLVYDVPATAPRRSLEILTDLHLDELLVSRDIKRFVELERAWLAQFAVEALNKRFYQELSNWFYWAAEHSGVSFPDERGDKLSEGERTELRHRHLIRLITRLMFVWFLREKELVPDRLFRENDLGKLLTDFDPRSKENSDYYQAILQNLFFATLNTEMGKGRKFLGKTTDGYNPEHGIPQVYRYPELFQDQTQALAAFADVPFLNGGLFECLDATTDKSTETPERRIDGFSSVPGKRARIPNEVFFLSDERPTPELNKVYGTKGKKYGVRGLVTLLSAYKFTTTENTPVEEEVALDPELLGKVFENLLAAVVEETQDTARKKTGSFYTPRYVVDDMTDDALLTYFGGIMGRKGDMPERLSTLLAYTPDKPEFSQAERERLVRAVNELDILDPACGSGAFPMGALQKLVHVLGRVDPGNTLWLEEQKEREIGKEIQRLRDDEQTAKRISEQDIRALAVDKLHIRMAEIEKAFDDRYANHDYARKLFLIENCIYGVDLQPIAVQIAKLRCFISLIVDQHTSGNAADNRGILPLPNLESQFVAANTLGKVGQDASQSFADSDPEVMRLRVELAAVRHEHFLARTHRVKKELRKRDRAIREKLAHELSRLPGTSQEDARQLADFDPYDQNASAGFFDAKWMFNLDGGLFDIVIGNPPYGSTINKKGLEKLYFLQDQWDSYLVFLERAIDLCKSDGVIEFIIPNTWLINLKQQKMRKFIFANKHMSSVKFYNKKIFDAVVDTYIFSIVNKKPDESSRTKLVKYDIMDFPDVWSVKQFEYKDDTGEAINIFAKSQQRKLALMIRSRFTILDNLADISSGIVPYEVGKGNPPQTREMVKNRVYDSTYRVGSNYQPVLRGSDFHRFTSPEIKDSWIKYGSNLAAPRKKENFIVPEKIVIRQTGDSIIATIDNRGFICLKNVHTLSSQQINLKYLLGLLNSKLITFYFRYINPEVGEVLPEVKRDHVGKLPIAATTSEVEGLVVQLVNTLLLLSAQPQTPSLALMIAYFERVLDALVYELYLPEELHGLGYEPFKIISAHEWPSLSGDTAHDLAALEAVFTAWYDPEHSIRQLTYYLDSVPAVRIVEGKEENVSQVMGDA